jgi:hypothetical protein
MKYVDTVQRLQIRALMKLNAIQNTYSVDKELKRDLQSLREIICSIDENIVTKKQRKKA